MKTQRTALLVRCTQVEAQLIRESAKRERRTISGYILHAVMNRIAGQARALETFYTEVPAKTKGDLSATRRDALK